ncbi:cobalt-precorrin-5B (C(1))-methyltransferase CbiD [Stenomitos frigidus]|uniref:Cobalt-precorrin-5B C(1)-methyltransferase n=1 Tax=Stenomitos frigidus ULC18 TaxID=2107698 RepID=A0A2T1EB26_9CYAN|nr:cobalt-precorrin-5B (C(1))-methyltransferase CbiD [Stenomitos frigidus]PSB29937.1 cobalt-precorrin-5B (C(1))-methyltransferase [Stenomitos frigidus ULC18]
MPPPPPRAGYTLPVFACAAAIAALRWLRQPQVIATVEVDLLEPAETVAIPIEQVAGLKPGAALAMTRSDPGDNLDLTRHTPLWAMVEWGDASQTEAIVLHGGEGLGRQADGQAAIYAYAKRLLNENLKRLLEPDETIQVTLILPEGRALAKRTSNEAFGVVEGLSLLGTTGISQPLSAPGQLEAFREALRQKTSCFDCLVFCIGENGLDLVRQLGVQPSRLVKTANWLGPMLVEAGLQGVKSVLLFGYHGKLIKLASGIFHTHHHVADGRLETLTAHCAIAGLPTRDLQAVFSSATAEDGLKYLKQLDVTTGQHWIEQVYGEIAQAIDERSQAYIQTHSDRTVQVGTILFDRERQILTKSQTGIVLLEQVLLI